MLQKAKTYLGWVLAALVIAAVVVALASCKSSRAERQLAERECAAEQRTAVLCKALEQNAPLDSIRAIAEATDKVYFYVFNAQQMVYWSTNRLSAEAVYLYAYDVWRES